MREKKISQEAHEQQERTSYPRSRRFISTEGGFLRLMAGRRGSPLKQAAWGGFVHLPQSLHGQDLDHVNDHTRNLQRG